MSLIIKNVSVFAEGKKIVKNFSLIIRPGEIHALMGPNGSGKSSLAGAAAGHPFYKISGGLITLDGKNIKNLPPEKIAKLGLFLSFQEPPEVGGISLSIFLSKISVTARRKNFDNKKKTAESLKVSEDFLGRFLNEGFSGGEKKKSEIMQFVARSPRYAIFDEIDSGLDMDSLKTAAEIIKKAAQLGAGILVISHTSRMLEKLNPDFIHVMAGGEKTLSGPKELLGELERKGYAGVSEK